jgi:hypothetical protein
MTKEKMLSLYGFLCIALVEERAAIAKATGEQE